MEDSIFKMELDCHNTIGDERYSFYHPIEIGDFTLCCWESSTKEQSFGHHRKSGFHTEAGYSLSLYESGTIIVPQRDSRFAHCRWAKLTDGRLGVHDLSRVIRDVKAVSRSAQQRSSLSSSTTQGHSSSSFSSFTRHHPKASSPRSTLSTQQLVSPL